MSEIKPEILTEDEWLWLRRARNESEAGDYVCSWHLRARWGDSTPSVNRKLMKLVKKGFLRKEAQRTHTKFYFINQTP